MINLESLEGLVATLFKLDNDRIGRGRRAVVPLILYFEIKYMNTSKFTKYKTRIEESAALGDKRFKLLRFHLFHAEWMPTMQNEELLQRLR